MKLNVTVASCVVMSLAACAPRAAYVGPVGDFAAAQASASSAVKPDVDAATTTDRIKHVRGEIHTIVTAGTGRPNVVVRSPRNFLCEGIVSREDLAFHQSYVATTAANLSAIAKPPPEKFEDLVKQLAERYQIRVDETFNPGTERSKCLDLYDNPAKWKARYPSGQASTESIAEAIGTAQAVYALVAKLGQIILTEVDDARRAKAFKDFFADKGATEKLRTNIRFLRTTLSTRLDVDRAKAHRSYEAAFAPLPTLLQTMTAQGVPACAAWRAAPKPGDPTADPNFRACYDALWARVEPTLAKALVAASTYDPLVLAQENEAFEALEKSIGKMEQLADGKLDNLEELKFIIQAAVKVFNAVDEVKKTVNSDDTKATIKKVDALLAQYR